VYSMVFCTTAYTDITQLLTMSVDRPAPLADANR
jgi:hypothetical protein